MLLTYFILWKNIIGLRISYSGAIGKFIIVLHRTRLDELLTLSPGDRSVLGQPPGETNRS